MCAMEIVIPRCFSSGAFVDIVERELGVQVRVLVVQNLRDRSRQRRLAMVDVTDGADVDVRLGPLELRLAHYGPPQDLISASPYDHAGRGDVWVCGVAERGYYRVTRHGSS
jgi:hypothetical protein